MNHLINLPDNQLMQNNLHSPNRNVNEIIVPQESEALISCLLSKKLGSSISFLDIDEIISYSEATNSIFVELNYDRRNYKFRIFFEVPH